MPKDIRPDCTHFLIMKIQNKRELKQIASQNLSDIDFQDFVSTAKPYSFLVNDHTVPLDNLSRFRKNLLETLQKLIMRIGAKIGDKKLQYDISNEVAERPALSS